MTVWRSSGAVAVLGTGLALPGTPVATAALLDALGSCLDKRGRATAAAIAARMGIKTRHVSRPWHARAEGPAPGCSNPNLAAAAVRAALADAGLRASDLGYCRARSVRNASAGGQDEQLCEVKSSTTTGDVCA
jgi:3-oxoacyl-[acyl-carrier-protein] synthase-3